MKKHPVWQRILAVLLLLSILIPPHSAYADGRKIIFIGDSRTVQMHNTLIGGKGSPVFDTDANGDTWSAKGSEGLSWMKETGVPQIEGRIDGNTDVVILMGVNEVIYGSGRWEDYISYINEKAAIWKQKGARTFYCAVTPVGKGPGDDSYKKITNKGTIASWNRAMKNGLTGDVGYIDTYNAIIGSYSSGDGLHYTKDTYKKIYECIKSATGGSAYATGSAAALSTPFVYTVTTGPPDTHPITVSGEGAYIIEEAAKYVGNPYVWGGNSLTKGIDCSHYVWQILKITGFYDGSYRTSKYWIDVGELVCDGNTPGEECDRIAEAGDIVVWDGHVAIADGQGMIYEAKGSAFGITHDRSIADAMGSHPFLGIVRVTKGGSTSMGGGRSTGMGVVEFLIWFFFGMRIGGGSSVSQMGLPSGGARKVCIDPGHQDHEMKEEEPIGPGASQGKKKLSPGTKGTVSGKYEYEVVLEIGLKLKTELERRGYEVSMTRSTNNVNLSNVDRAQYANGQQSEVFLRLHCDYNTDASRKGVHAIAPANDNPYLEEKIIEKSQKLADILAASQAKATGQVTQTNSRRNDLTGINWAKMPVTIVEMGFMSNVEEDRFLTSTDGQGKIVKGLADGLDEYFSTVSPSGSSSFVEKLDAAKDHDQIIAVLANGSSAKVGMYEKSGLSWTTVFETDGYVGRNGIGKTKEGDGKTPRGTYHFTDAFGIKADPGCGAFSYRKCDDSWYWVDDPDSRYYNQFVSLDRVSKDWDSAEHITGIGAPYHYCLALDYNADREKGKGSAIFLHCSSSSPTSGCISIPEEKMIEVLQKVKKDCAIVIMTQDEAGRL